MTVLTYEIATALNVRLDLMLVRKLGVPGHEELAMGAIASGGVRVLNHDILRMLGLGAAAVDSVVSREAHELQRRDQAYRAGRPVPVLQGLRPGTVLVGQLAPLADAARGEAIIARDLVAFPLERLPRTTRAQAMDVLSSQAGMAGYKAVLLGAQLAPRFFPMLTTAAGTIRPSRVLVIGAGVAGLQAVATAKRLGAQVEGFDVRPETREQIESLGGRFLDLGVSAAGEGGYARQLTDEERAEQQRRLGEHLKLVDVVVTTAAVPGRPAPKILSAAMVAGMRPGSVVVDLAAETGGNCECTRPGETVDVGGVTVAGPLNVASSGATHASEMFARNVLNFVSLFVRDGAIDFDCDDELLAKTVWPPRPEAPSEAPASAT